MAFMICMNCFRITPLLAVLLLSACAQNPSPPPSPTPPPVVAEPAVPAPAPGPTAAERREYVVRSLLAQAEAALEADKLLQPLASNAYDRFQAVLLLQPDNQQAQSGLKQIAARYVQLSRDALGHSKIIIAREYARNAAQVDPQSPLLAELQVAIEHAAAQQAKAPSELEFPLALQALNQRDVQKLPVLEELVTRVKQTDETLLIVARNDAEGRWLYQQLRSFAGGYRIRGDIKVGPQPHIVVLPPIE